MEMRCVSRRLSPVAALKRTARQRPESTTAVMPPMVSEVSAMGVASTILRCPSGLYSSARYCSCGAMSPYSGMTSASGRVARSSSAQRSISA